MRLVVAWETFVSEWFIGCVNRDATRYKQASETRMNNWLRAEAEKKYDRYDPTFPWPTLSLGRTPKLSEVRELLDPREGNI